MWNDLQQTPPFRFVQEHDVVFGWLAFVSFLLFIGSLFVVPLLVTWIPADYFTREYRETRERTPLQWAGLVLKNVVGLVLLLAGIAMLLFPGQGILAILVGLSLMNFPGKRTLEIKLVSRPAVLKTINWLRGRANKPPLSLGPGDAGTGGPGEGGTGGIE